MHGAAGNAKLRTIFGASVELGKQLGMRVVAEGVEDRADWDLLRRSGCDLAQGYFITRPLPPQELRAWHASWKLRLLTESLLEA